MWHHLYNRFQRVPILRGLPEGSRLSPTLFGLFAADLVNHLERKYPVLVRGEHSSQKVIFFYSQEKGFPTEKRLQLQK